LDASESYKLLECIGEGGAGPVYRAETSAGSAAVRQFRPQAPPDTPESRAERKHFLDAANQALKLKHNRIVPVLEVIDEAGEAFEVMELQSDPNLQTVLETQPMTPAEADVLLRQIAIALDFAHGGGVVHGDLKPSNVFVGPQQGAKVSDFAISPRARRDRRSLPPKLAHAYLSPEHFRAPSSLGPQSDQYSLAAIAYEMYTGRSPYGAAASSPQSAVLSAAIAPPSRVNRKLPPAVDAPLLRALNRDPAHRFGSCLEFVATLDAGLISQPEPRGAAGSHKLLYAGIASLVVALLILFLQFRSGNKRVETAAVSPPPSPAAAPADTRKAATGRVGKKTKSATDAAAPRGDVPSPKPTPFGGTPGKVGKQIPKSPPVQAVLHGAAPAGDSAALPAPPPATQPRLEPPAPISPTIATRGFTLTVLSRDRPIGRDSSFSLDDQLLGELASGDLKASVQYDGAQPPRGTLTLGWTVDGVLMSLPKRVAPNQIVEYGNEPTAGAYTVTLWLDTRAVQTFTFRITK